MKIIFVKDCPIDNYGDEVISMGMEGVLLDDVEGRVLFEGDDLIRLNSRDDLDPLFGIVEGIQPEFYILKRTDL